MIYLDSLIVEVTRRCNMSCNHCLRGEPQRLDMSEEILEAFFSKSNISRIGTIMFTGGEPTLRPDIMELTYKIAKHYDISIGRFWFATNGKTIKSDLFRVIEWMIDRSDDQEGTVEISNDQFHDENNRTASNKQRYIEFNDYLLARYGQPYSGMENYIIPRTYRTINNVIPVGRGMNYGGTNWRKEYPVSIKQEDDYIDIESSLYLNCKGKIIADCDKSYFLQRKKEFIISDVFKEDYNLLEDCKKFKPKEEPCFEYNYR